MIATVSKQLGDSGSMRLEQHRVSFAPVGTAAFINVSCMRAPLKESICWPTRFRTGQEQDQAAVEIAGRVRANSFHCRVLNVGDKGRGRRRSSRWTRMRRRDHVAQYLSEVTTTILK